MAGTGNIREFCESTIVDWVTKNAGVRKERIVLQRRLTEEPYNLSVVKVLNMMDDVVKLYNTAYGSHIVLAQNWRLAHRLDKLGDLIEAVAEVASTDDIGRVKKTGIA